MPGAVKLIDPWNAVSALAGVCVSAGLVFLREALAQRRDSTARSEERARLEGELVATLREQGAKLDRIQHRLDSLPCVECIGGREAGAHV